MAQSRRIFDELGHPIVRLPSLVFELPALLERVEPLDENARARRAFAETRGSTSHAARAAGSAAPRSQCGSRRADKARGWDRAVANVIRVEVRTRQQQLRQRPGIVSSPTLVCSFIFGPWRWTHGGAVLLLTNSRTHVLDGRVDLALLRGRCFGWRRATLIANSFASSLRGAVPQPPLELSAVQRHRRDVAVVEDEARKNRLPSSLMFEA